MARAPQPATTDPVAVRVLTKGEPLSAPTGRADDFTWPRDNVVTAEPGAQQAPAAASTPAATAPAARTATTAPTTTPTASDRTRARAKQPPANAAQQRASNPDGADTDAAAPARRRPRPPAPTNIAPRDDVPRPPGLIGGR